LSFGLDIGLPRQKLDLNSQRPVLLNLSPKKSPGKQRLFCDSRRRQHIGVSELVRVPREVARLHQPALDERAQAVVNRSQTDAYPLPHLPLGQFRVLVQQAQDLEPRLFLDFRFIVQFRPFALPPDRRRSASNRGLQGEEYAFVQI